MWVEKRTKCGNNVHADVILLVRMWVENLIVREYADWARSSSLWGCELKIVVSLAFPKDEKSSSLWGCELKIKGSDCTCISFRHPPCEDVSWKSENISEYYYDDVILLVRMWVEKPNSQLVTVAGETSSSLWGCELKSHSAMLFPEKLRHPPCEDVSWKTKLSYNEGWTDYVILLVRMWVEKWLSLPACLPPSSSSLWGCELKKFPA